MLRVDPPDTDVVVPKADWASSPQGIGVLLNFSLRRCTLLQFITKLLEEHDNGEELLKQYTMRQKLPHSVLCGLGQN